MEDLLENKCKSLIDIVKEVKLLLSTFEEEYKVKIPLIAGGGIRTRDDINGLKEAGADGFQIGSPKKFHTVYPKD